MTKTKTISVSTRVWKAIRRQADDQEISIKDFMEDHF